MSEPEAKRPIYLDHHSTTPVDPRVLDVMLPYFTEHFGNAASTDHEYGAYAFTAVEEARRKIAAAIGATPSEIIFTSGATEADNLAILGVAEQYADRGNHIITCVTEHKAVLDTCAYLQGTGWNVTYLPVDRFGIVAPEDVRSAITSKTVLVSIMTANNEIGTIAPITEIGAITREAGILFHTDATQAIGRIPVDVNSENIDLLSMSAHKIYGPKGIGTLFVRKLSPRVKVASQMHGGGHERGMRSGTLNVPAIVGFGKAVELAQFERESETNRLRTLRDNLLQELQTRIQGIVIHGHLGYRLSNNLNVHIPGINNRSLVVQLKHELAISTGSACTTAKVEPSHVLLALGYNSEHANSSIRFGLGRSTTHQEILQTSEALVAAICRLRRIV